MVSISILFPRHLSQFCSEFLEGGSPGCPQKLWKETVLASRELRVHWEDKHCQWVSTAHDVAAVQSRDNGYLWHSLMSHSPWFFSLSSELCLRNKPILVLLLKN